MPYYCTVPRCTSMAGKAKNVSFHQFPRDEELAKLWNKILKRGKPYTKYSKVCSLHFTPEDYTITSVGKNKGQWRTLRKDAIPSQNLPSESPTPYQRKQWSTWTRDQPSNFIDPTIHQQVAQAIYMQTMLAMQATGATDMSAINNSNGFPPVSTEAFAHSSTTSNMDIFKGKQTNTQTKSNSYKCTECSKCFKDPDVFILHKRSHKKNEKENFNLNLTLQANPILANLLRTNTENSNIFDNNFSVESLLMRALAANMEGYMRNFSMIKSEIGHDDHDNDQSDQEDGHVDNRSHSDHENGHLDHENDNLGQDRDNLSYRGSYYENNEKRDSTQDVQSTSNVLINGSFPSDTMDHNESDINHDSSLMNRDSIFNDRIIEHYRNNTYDNRSVRYYDNDVNNDSGSQEGDRDISDRDRDMTDHDRNKMDSDSEMPQEAVMDHSKHKKNDLSMLFHGRSMTDCGRGMTECDMDMIDHDRGMTDDDKCNGDDVTNDDDSQSSSDESICDLNESIDSNKLVIDETV